jgi:hypothetical protein
MPSTSIPDKVARIVADAMTLLMPGAGPPPARIAIFFSLCSIYGPYISARRKR